MKPIRIAWCLAAAALVLGCDQVTEPAAEDASATPLFSPADGNGNKRVFEWDDYYEGWVNCGGGVVLDLHDSGFAQRTPASGWGDNDRKKWVWHVELEYINPVTGRSFKVHDVGPDKWYVDKDGNVIHTITGRSVTGSGYIGHVVIDDETGEILSISGQPFNFGDADARACEKLS
jgi:hypothetical protein